MSAIENAANRALAALAPPGLLTGCRSIRPGDARYLLPAERASIATREPGARTASGTGRRVAHELLRRLGYVDLAILRGRAGAPIWPAGAVGSIAHDDEVAVAVAARAASVASLGIDIEPALPLPSELGKMVIAPRDRLGDLDPGIGGRVLFAAKEAVYKASFPLDGRMLDFEDIAVDLETGEAVTSSGLRLSVRFTIFPKVLALAQAA